MAEKGDTKMPSCVIGKFEIPETDFEEDVGYLNDLPKQSEEYDEFAQGYWKNVSLMNSTGDSSDSRYVNTGFAIRTDHMSRCPSIDRFIRENFDVGALRMVRARNLIDGMVVPHKDFVELSSDKNYFRVFVPLERNDDSFHSDEKGVFNMKPGEVWFLDASMVHAAINFSSRSRMFLCLDFVFENRFLIRIFFVRGLVFYWITILIM